MSGQASRSGPICPWKDIPLYREGVQKLVFGAKHPAVAEKRIATIQTIGGTGAVGIAADFLAKHCPGRRSSSATRPGRTITACSSARVSRRTTYPYWDRANRSVDFDGMVKALEAAENGSIVVLQPRLPQPDRRRSRRAPAASRHRCARRQGPHRGVRHGLSGLRHRPRRGRRLRAPLCGARELPRRQFLLEEFLAVRRALRRLERRLPRCRTRPSACSAS